MEGFKGQAKLRWVKLEARRMAGCSSTVRKLKGKRFMQEVKCKGSYWTLEG